MKADISIISILIATTITIAMNIGTALQYYGIM